MDLNEAIYKYLVTVTDLTAVTSTRIYPDALPQNPTYPAITFNALYEGEIDTFNQPITMISPVVQFDCWALTRASSEAVAKQLRLAWKNYSGLMGGSGGLTVSAVRKIGKANDTYTDTVMGGDNQLTFRALMEFEINYQEEAS